MKNILRQPNYSYILFVFIYSLICGIIYASNKTFFLAPPGTQPDFIMPVSKSDKFLIEITRKLLIKNSIIEAQKLNTITDEEILEILNIVSLPYNEYSRTNKIEKIFQKFKHISLSLRSSAQLVDFLLKSLSEILLELEVEELINDKTLLQELYDENAWTNDRADYNIGRERECCRGVLSRIINAIFSCYLRTTDTTILDAGAGEGWLGSVINDALKNTRRIIGFDKNIIFLDRAKEKDLYHETIVGDIEALSHHIAQTDTIKEVDAIIACDSFDTFIDLDKVLEECYKTLKPGGRIIIFQIIRIDPKAIYDTMIAQGNVFCPTTIGYYPDIEKMKLVLKPFLRARNKDALGKVDDPDFIEFINLRNRYEIHGNPVFRDKLLKGLEQAGFSILHRDLAEDSMECDREERHTTAYTASGKTIIPKSINTLFMDSGMLEFQTVHSVPPIPSGKIVEKVKILAVIAEKPLTSAEHPEFHRAELTSAGCQ